jgi:hypothetical protein
MEKAPEGLNVYSLKDESEFRAPLGALCLNMLLLKEQEWGESTYNYKHVAPDGASPLCITQNSFLEDDECKTASGCLSTLTRNRSGRT